MLTPKETFLFEFILVAIYNQEPKRFLIAQAFCSWPIESISLPDIYSSVKRMQSESDEAFLLKWRYNRKHASGDMGANTFWSLTSS